MESSSGSSFTQRSLRGLLKENNEPIELIEHEYDEYHSSRPSQSDFEEEVYGDDDFDEN